MNPTLASLKKIAPDVTEVLHRRYELLCTVSAYSPLGRRALAQKMGMTERLARAECDKLRELGLIELSQSGMSLTEEGRALCDELSEVFSFYFADQLLEKLRQGLQMNEIIISEGDLSAGSASERALDKRAAQYVGRCLHDQMKMAVMGGSTIAGIARQLSVPHDLSGVTVLPARGGLGEDMDLQANTVAAAMANAIGANYRIIHLSDDMPADILPPAAHRRYMEWLAMLGKTDLLLFGIGRADRMANRRGLGSDQFQEIRRSGAVAEALGYYFDRQGRIVHAASELKVDLDVFSSIPVRIAVAGGTDKAEAILSVIRGVKPTALILDEAAAGAMCVLLDSGQ